MKYVAQFYNKGILATPLVLSSETYEGISLAVRDQLRDFELTGSITNIKCDEVRIQVPDDRSVLG